MTYISSVHTRDEKIIVCAIHDDYLEVIPRWNDGKEHPPDEPFQLTRDQLEELILSLQKWRKELIKTIKRES